MPVASCGRRRRVRMREDGDGGVKSGGVRQHFARWWFDREGGRITYNGNVSPTDRVLSISRHWSVALCIFSQFLFRKPSNRWTKNISIHNIHVLGDSWFAIPNSKMIFWQVYFIMLIFSLTLNWMSIFEIRVKSNQTFDQQKHLLNAYNKTEKKKNL